MTGGATPEHARLSEDAQRLKNWKRWGPYLSERQWGTVREDYSENGDAWSYFPHDHARSRAYRWGEDGLLGICDREGRLCFALALWNGRDPILKERLFGLSGHEGNHGEDVKECYYYVESTPTHSYMKALYKYPQREFPYAQLTRGNAARGRREPELEIVDTGVFDEGDYFDIWIEYAKASPNDILIRIAALNRGDADAPLSLLPTLWFRNTWSWGRTGEGHGARPVIQQASSGVLETEHPTLERFRLAVDQAAEQGSAFLFCENETNRALLYGTPNGTEFVKDGFHDYLINGRTDAVSLHGRGTKAAALFRVTVPAGDGMSLRLRLTATAETPAAPFGRGFDQVFEERIREADQFYSAMVPPGLSGDELRIVRQGYAGLLWSKQFYHYAVSEWLEGDPSQPPPPTARARGRNSDWPHLYNRDVVSVPDKWEYPWYAAWDLAFHMIPFCTIDPHFAKSQLILLLREWYMHPNGQLPAYEWGLGDVNPPVHAWAVWRVYKMSAPKGGRDDAFLARAFQKLLLNFTWWVNRKDPHGRHLFSGGFLGLDNVGVFDRSHPPPIQGHLEQADGTAWMAFCCGIMLSMALELARRDPVYEDIASKFFEHFMAIVSAMNSVEGDGLWDEEDGFYYDHIHGPNGFTPLRLRSIVGLLPIIAVQVLEDDVIDALPGFRKRMLWFLENRKDLVRTISLDADRTLREGHRHRILSIVSRKRLERVLRYMLDPQEFLSPHGIRSLSKLHESSPYVLRVGSEEYQVRYAPAESDTALFGGNSNWRGPIWFPVNYLIIEALERYHHYYGDKLRVEFPTGSGSTATLGDIADDLSRRLISLFLPDKNGSSPWRGVGRFAEDPAWRNFLQFHEYFHADTGQGLGASHQTGWTALVVSLVEDLARKRGLG
jgi:hypothetical protein